MIAPRHAPARRVLDLLRLCRLYYAVPMASILPLTAWYAAGDDIILHLPQLLWATAALLSLIAFGYVLNDVCDSRVDRLNAPARPIAAGRIPPTIAMIWALLLLSAALFAAARCPRAFFLGMLTVGALVILYDLTSKRLGLGKQLLVALLMTSYYPLSFALVGATTASRVPTLFAFPVWLFLTSFGYETLKDIRDMAGDRTVTSRPSWLQRHPSRALQVARAAILAGAATLLAPAFLGCGWMYTAIIPAAIVLAYGSTRQPPRRALPFIYAEVVVVGIAALGDIVILGS